MFKEKNQKKGIISSILLHAIILILFSLYGLTIPIPRPEQGMLINFGTDDFGSGDIQSDIPAPTQEETLDNPTETTSESTPVENAIEEILTTQDLENLEVESGNEESKPTKEPSEEIEEKPKELDSKLKQTLENAFKKNAGSNEGDDKDKAGDKGSLDGSKDSKNYTGGGSGNGFSYSLAGREVAFVPKIIDNSQEEGKVVVDIKVDRNGNVIDAKPGARGSTTSSAILYRKAKEAAEKTKFTANPIGPAEQRGVITFVFILE